jgi:hypothetical protein
LLTINILAFISSPTWSDLLFVIIWLVAQFQYAYCSFDCFFVLHTPMSVNLTFISQGIAKFRFS